MLGDPLDRLPASLGRLQPDMVSVGLKIVGKHSQRLKSLRHMMKLVENVETIQMLAVKLITLQPNAKFVGQRVVELPFALADLYPELSDDQQTDNDKQLDDWTNAYRLEQATQPVVHFSAAFDRTAKVLEAALQSLVTREARVAVVSHTRHIDTEVFTKIVTLGVERVADAVTVLNLAVRALDIVLTSGTQQLTMTNNTTQPPRFDAAINTGGNYEVQLEDTTEPYANVLLVFHHFILPMIYEQRCCLAIVRLSADWCARPILPYILHRLIGMCVRA
jgi:hypothetical protein